MTPARTPPAELKRRLMVEAGHRCAIPTCRAVAPLEFEHIEDWSRVQRHEFANMIVLCANCHGRKGNAQGQIDRRALRQYKANLAVINSRYGDLERRVLEYFAGRRQETRAGYQDDADAIERWRCRTFITLPGTMRLLMNYVAQDGHVELLRGYQGQPDVESPAGAEWTPVQDLPPEVLPGVDYFRLTATGIQFLDAWTGAQPIDGAVPQED